MGPFTLAVIFVFTFCLQQSFADDPVFPSFSGDITAQGYMMVQDQLKVPFKSWFSDSRKAYRQDIKGHYRRSKHFVLENEGSYGAEVTIWSETKPDQPGKRGCIFNNGTAEKTIKYRPMFSFPTNAMKYVGSETVDGVDLQKWEYKGSLGGYPVVYTSHGKNGPVPVRIVGERSTIYIREFYSEPIPDSIFEYNRRLCSEKTEVSALRRPYENMQSLFQGVFN